VKEILGIINVSMRVRQCSVADLCLIFDGFDYYFSY
jgi:hypothetical protein